MEVRHDVALLDDQALLHYLVESRQHDVVRVNIALQKILHEEKSVECNSIVGVDQHDVVGLGFVVAEQAKLLRPPNLPLKSLRRQFDRIYKLNREKGVEWLAGAVELGFRDYLLGSVVIVHTILEFQIVHTVAHYRRQLELLGHHVGVVSQNHVLLQLLADAEIYF